MTTEHKLPIFWVSADGVINDMLVCVRTSYMWIFSLCTANVLYKVLLFDKPIMNVYDKIALWRRQGQMVLVLSWHSRCVPSAESSRSVRGLGKGVSSKPYPRLCNTRRPRLEPETFRSQAVRLYRLHQARPSVTILYDKYNLCLYLQCRCKQQWFCQLKKSLHISP